MATTWNPAFLHAGSTLSNFNLTLAESDSATNTTSRSIATLPNKFFCSFKLDSVVTTDNVGVGICNVSQLTTVSLSASLNATGYFSGGGVWINGSSVSSIGSFTTGDIVDMAVDFGHATIWFRKNGGNWNNSGGANPATNSGGISIASLNVGPYYAAGEVRNGQLTANFGADVYRYVEPTGFVTPDTILANDDKSRLIYAAEVATFSVPARN